jgi:hypothetical protein
MARETFFSRTVSTENGDKIIHASILFDETRFGIDPAGVSPWTIAMHGLKPDKSAKRGVEMTVFRVNDDLRALGFDAQVYSAFERWLLKRGWKSDVLKKLKFMDTALVVFRK